MSSVTISVIIACRNECAFIKKCVENVLDFAMPTDSELEVLVIDGMSEDGTRKIVCGIAARDPRVRLIDNLQQSQVFAFNLGIRHASGEWVAILGAHARYPSDYLTLSLDSALRTGADNVGGIAVTTPRDESYSAALVQALTTHRFGVGNSRFRVGGQEGPADTVPGGFYRRAAVRDCGWFDERLIRHQDYEFNRRLKLHGGKIWLDPAISYSYFNQGTVSAFLKKQFFREGPYNAYMWYVAPYSFTPRHVASGLFASGGLAFTAMTVVYEPLRWIWLSLVLIYGLAALLAAGQQAVRYRRWGHILALPGCFFLYHFVHGLGVLSGVLRLAFGRAPVQYARQPHL